MGVIRKTKSVTAILALFKAQTHAISAVQLTEMLGDKMNKTTIYRILERLESDGIVHSFTDTNGLKWYATCKNCSARQHKDIHPHFQCEKCGQVDCLSVSMQIPAIPNRKINFSQMLLVGTCENCK